MARKIESDYAAEILTLHTALIEYPESDTLQAKINTQLSEWAKRLQIIVQVASNEQTPWTPDELGYPCIPMGLKKQTGFDQVGDYHFYIEGYGPAGLVIERKGGKKGVEDLYGTLMRSDERARFYRELDRFRQDARFNQFILITECTLQQFMEYAPAFNGNRRNTNHTGASATSRRATIASLLTRGCPVLFAGTRYQAVQLYKDLIRQWIMKNYVTILGL